MTNNPLQGLDVIPQPSEQQNDDIIHLPADDVGQFGEPYFRWTLLYALIIFLLTLSPIWLSFVIPDYIVYFDAIMLLIFAAIWIAIAFNAINNMNRMLKVPTPTVEGLKVARTRQFYHIVVVPCYLDPIEVLFDALGTLLMQADPSRLIVVIAFEAKTPELQAKQNAVHEAFHRRFGHFLVTTHVLNREKEIAGGCSNKNFALRSAYDYILKNQLLKNTSNKNDFHKPAVTVTTCDTDSLFHPNYFAVLEQVYNAKYPGKHPGQQLNLKESSYCVWQPPLFYNWDLDERPFFNRITCLTRSLMMLGGLIGFNLNPMSVFSYPVELGLQAGFINPRYGVDDIIAKVRWMCTTSQQIPVELLPIPSISGPTIGTTFVEEYNEWARQIRRWIIGSSESFHYFIMHWRGQPFFNGLSWFFMFFMYYAVLLCSAGIFSLLAGITWPWIDYPNYPGTNYSMASIGWIYLVVQYVVFAVAFYIDARAKQMMTVKEKKMTLWRNVLHWLASPLSLLLYSIIAFRAIIAFIWVGKKFARHDMAAKTGLETRRADEATSPTGYDKNADTLEPHMIPRRSTSMSKEHHDRTSLVINEQRSQSVVEMTNSTDAKDTEPQAQTTNNILMVMPKKFWFGEYCYEVPPLGPEGVNAV